MVLVADKQFHSAITNQLTSVPFCNKFKFGSLKLYEVEQLRWLTKYFIMGNHGAHYHNYHNLLCGRASYMQSLMK